MNQNLGKSANSIVWLILVVVVAGLLIVAFQPKEPETRLGRAADEIGEGIDNAARAMKPDSEKTLGEKTGEAIRNVGDRIEENSSN